jgi:DNA-binding transcriptional regulator LsrR (DeoR family)
MTVAKRLAHRVRSDSECPGLWLHAMSSGGFSVENPNRDAPVTYFGFFDNALPEMHYVGLFSPTVVRCEDYDAFKKTPGVDRSFELAQQIDIVVTSFAMAGDEHGLLRRFLTLVQAEEELDSLEREHWVGEMQFRPFSATGPVVADHGIRAVTLFELSELVELAQADDKFIVLLSAPCLKCGETRADALRYLLKVPELRAWTHLVTDVRTAADLLR